MGPKKRGTRKRKAEEEAEEREASMPKRRRNKKYIGAHVSITGKACGRFSRLLYQPRVASAGGIWKAVETCTAIGANCFALFLGSQRSWKRPPLDPKAAGRFQEQRSLHEIDPAYILPHGSYLMNCGSPKTGLAIFGFIVYLYFGLLLFFCLFFLHK